jgi:NADH-quinone oxidoreductase subunit J
MTQTFFYLIAVLVVVGGLGVVTVRNTVYAALFLIMSLLGVAGVYILLSVEFLALVQVLIYAGAVTVLILFALMLTRVRDLGATVEGGQRLAGAVGGLGLLAAFSVMLHQTTWPRDVGQITPIPFNDVGTALFNRWAVPFEIASGVLLVALVGAIILSLQEEGER